jgi:hypothetical protein
MWPAGHGAHVDAPEARAVNPSAHASQTRRPGADCANPGAHGAHASAARLTATEPASHITHAAIPRAAAAYPGSHAVHPGALLTAEYVPVLHTSHTLVPPGSVDETKVPAGQLASTDAESTDTPTASLLFCIAVVRAAAMRVTSETFHPPPSATGYSAGVLT